MFFFPKERENPSCYYLINHTLSAQPQAIGFFCAKSLDIFSVQRFFGGNFQAPNKQRFGFCGSSLFHCATMTFTTTLLGHLARAQKRKTNLRSHDLKISGKKDKKIQE